ncbi:helix-turn-helix domain-containing protein [Rhizorhabdus wittichii]|uniref:helix-turn-helix domain-containing protein n=1 Tax=Rhizorhabdus wittichii TaxID=160791 RepID=UPI000376BF86|nr:XRE family transcriptional regulator [Rhizorhabdus wittichii]
MTSQVIGPRLKALREARDVDQEKVAAILGVSSRQIVSQIETGERRVSADELLRLAEGLGENLDYFTDPYRIVGEGGFSWRQNGRSLVELGDYERTASSWIALYRVEAPRVGRPAPLRRPKLPLTRQSSFEDAMAEGERVCQELRLLDISSYPAAGLADAMEREFGILVLMVDAIDGVSGAACRLPDLDAVLVNRTEVAGRRHFDLAHELFHIMTWDEMPPEYSEDAHGFSGRRNRVEQLADNFASALLMPAAVIDRFGSWKKLGEDELTSRLNEVAELLQVTAQALKWRLAALRKLTQAVAKNVIDELLRNNGRERRDETVPPLFSRGFMEVLGLALFKGNVSRRRAARLLGLDLGELSNLFRVHGVQAPEGL